ncbi:hypothetical protein LS684_09670 [Cytobacillus spongiae]|uniref:hypothetical protein n=1 Tax=Cytobacillus spongiae TaxID=2901381 RepID=UPI001F4064CC|nr:hypothetical protein [Cytobacillus spongiae]UII57662.1 hypothetical protein LS684_09670 [Cytobacillus spongiae]
MINMRIRIVLAGGLLVIFILVLLQYSFLETIALKLTIISLLGMSLTILFTFFTKLWLHFIFLNVSYFFMNVVIYVFSITNKTKHFHLIFIIAIVIYTIRIVIAGWTKENKLD